MSINTYYSFIVFDIIKYKLLETEVIFITEVYDGGASTMDGKEEYDKGLELFYSNDVEKQREALNHFCLAAEKNHDEAMLYAGCILYYGWHGSLQNTSKAFNYFKKAVDCGIDGAKYYLAECYYKGKGVEPNIELAVQLFEEVAALGNPIAAYAANTLSAIYTNGYGNITKDENKAMMYNAQALQANVPGAEIQFLNLIFHHNPNSNV